MKLLQHVKTIVAFSNKRKRLDEVDNHHAILESMQLAARIAYEHEKGQRVWGGDKTKEMPRHNRTVHENHCPMDDMMAQDKHLNLARPMSTR